MTNGNTENIKKRIFIVFSFLSVLYLCAFLRDFYLQIIEHKILKERADKQTTQKIVINPVRGIVFDRNYRSLAVSIDVNSVYANPLKIKNPQKLKEVLISHQLI